MRSRCCWDAPGAVQEGVAQRGEDGDVVRPGGDGVGTDAAEGLEPAHAPPAPADLRLELGHPDRLLAAVVGPVDVEGDAEVQHLVDPLGHPFGQLVGLGVTVDRVQRIGALYLARQAMRAAAPASTASRSAAAQFAAALTGIDTDRRTQAGAPGLHPAAAKVLATLDLDRGVG